MVNLSALKGHPMELQLKLRYPARRAAGKEAPLRWIPGHLEDDRGAVAIPAPFAYSFLSACECPDDCLRDHENE